MTYRIYIQCSDCNHFYDPAFQWHCDAFPDGIPEDILDGSFNHKSPHEGDHGIQFEKKVEEGFKIPSEQRPVSQITMQKVMDKSARYYIEKKTKRLVRFDGRYAWYDGKKWIIDPALFKVHWMHGMLKEITQDEARKIVEKVK